jgi:drug/metabolite transporter (DMT)-like permease
MTDPSSRRPVLVARGLLILAAVLWSSGSLFSRLLTEDTGLGLDSPRLTPIQIAFWRGLFAGLSLLPLVRWGTVRFRPPMAAMMLCFTIMSGLYVSALVLGNAANAIFLQNTAPVWVYLIGVYVLAHAADVRTFRAMGLAMVGAVVIVVGNWPRDLTGDALDREVGILLMAVGSGFMYALVVLFLNYLKAESSAWLMVLNLVGSAAVLGGVVLARFGWEVFADWFATPTAAQLGFLAVFGFLQMAMAYWLFARSLRAVSPQEAGLITLLEPVLNPVWAYLIAPDRETPTVWTCAGGGVLLLALAWRYGVKPNVVVIARAKEVTDAEVPPGDLPQ